MQNRFRNSILSDASLIRAITEHPFMTPPHTFRYTPYRPSHTQVGLHVQSMAPPILNSEEFDSKVSSESESNNLNLFFESFDYSNTESIAQQLFCPLCFDVLKNPIVHQECRTTFCSSCFSKCNGKCPTCRSSDLTTVAAPLIIQSLLDELEVRCKHCSAVMKYEQAKHHYEKICNIACEHCKKNITRHTRTVHELTCYFTPKSCLGARYGCKFKDLAEKLLTHQENCIYSKCVKNQLHINSMQNELRNALVNQNKMKICVANSLAMHFLKSGRAVDLVFNPYLNLNENDLVQFCDPAMKDSDIPIIHVKQSFPLHLLLTDALRNSHGDSRHHLFPRNIFSQNVRRPTNILRGKQLEINDQTIICQIIESAETNETCSLNCPDIFAFNQKLESCTNLL